MKEREAAQQPPADAPAAPAQPGQQ